MIWGVNAPVLQDIGTTIMNTAAGLDLSGISVKVVSDNLEIYADPLPGKVFYNLMDNTLCYGRTVSEITVPCEKNECGLFIIYTDNGVGVDAGARPHLFERGFGKHTGPGLFLLKRSAQCHRAFPGRIRYTGQRRTVRDYGTG